MREFITIVEAEGDQPMSPVDAFLKELGETTHEHPFNHRQRIVGQYLGTVEVSPSLNDRRNAIHIHDLTALEPGKGHGSATLKILCDLADKHDVTLEGTAKAYREDRLSTRQLLTWYVRHGFKMLGGDEHDGYDIERRPVGKPTVIKLRGFNRPH